MTNDVCTSVGAVVIHVDLRADDSAVRVCLHTAVGIVEDLLDERHDADSTISRAMLDLHADQQWRLTIASDPDDAEDDKQ